MSRQKDRDEFLVIMAAEGLPVDIIRLVMRHGASLHRIAELQCSSEAADRDQVRCPQLRAKRYSETCLCRDYGSYDETEKDDPKSYGHGTVPRINVRAAQLQRRLVALLAPYKVELVFQGDPRGCVVKLKVPSGRTNDWGQVGICVP